MSYFVGGAETTTSLLTNILWRLLEVPERWERLRAEPSLIPVAVEESLRFDPPTLGTFRRSTREVDLHGHALPAGSKLFFALSSANRDPQVFERPDEFNLDRSSNELSRHLAFGHGAHFCPGAALSRLEARIALSVLVQRLPNPRLLGSGERIEPFNYWGRRSLPLAWGA